MGAVISVRVLGPIEGWVGDQRVELAGPRQLGLFALLALNANRAVSSDAIVEKLWGSDRGGANKSLQMTVARIRKALTAAGADAEATLRTVGHGYLLAVTVDQLDSERFASLTAAGQNALQVADPEHAQKLLSDALALWRGPPLPEVGFDDFAQAEIRRLEELRLLAVEAHAEADLMLGRHAELTGELSTLLVEHPDRERLAGQLMLALYRCGRQNEALEVYQQVRAHLLKDAGLAPGPALQELQGRILQQDPALETPTRSTTLGSAVDLNAMDNVHLPTPSSTLIGRGGEITAIADLLTDGTWPVTLTGSGGVGKTRMAVEVAHRIGGQQRDGARFVELAALADPDLVPATVATAVGVRLEPGADAISTLTAELADREQLLVIDNCEHVLDATAALVAARPTLPGTDGAGDQPRTVADRRRGRASGAVAVDPVGGSAGVRG